MVKAKSLVLSVAVLTGGVFLAACAPHGGRASYSSGGVWGSYQCTASTSAKGGQAFVGWATSKGRAQDNALHKCRAKNNNPGSCRIMRCLNESECVSGFETKSGMR